MPRKKLGEILVEAGVLDARALRQALEEQTRWGGYLGRHLVELGHLTEPVLIQALSKQLGLPSVDLDQWTEVGENVLDAVDAEDAQRLSAVPFRQEGRFLDVAMGDPMNSSAVDLLQISTKLNVRPYIAGPKAIERALARFYHKGSGLLDMSVKLEDQADGDMELVRGPLVQQTEELVRSPRPPSQPKYELMGGGPPPRGAGRPRTQTGDAPEIRALQERISRLEQLVARDEAVLRKLLSLLIDKGIATRDEIAERIK